MFFADPPPCGLFPLFVTFFNWNASLSLICDLIKINLFMCVLNTLYQIVTYGNKYQLLLSMLTNVYQS